MTDPGAASVAAEGWSSPRIVGTETPDVTFDIAANEAATTVLFVSDLAQDLCACGLDPGIYRVSVRDDDVHVVCLGADVPGMTIPLPKLN